MAATAYRLHTVHSPHPHLGKVFVRLKYAVCSSIAHSKSEGINRGAVVRLHQRLADHFPVLVALAIVHFGVGELGVDLVIVTGDPLRDDRVLR